MRIGFTGTRHGMTDEQVARLKLTLTNLKESAQLPMSVVHGGAIGADSQFHQIAYWLLEGCRTTIFPSDMPDQQDPSLVADERKEPMPPLKRNQKIVNISDVLIACPDSDRERLRSGTWATVRYASKVQVPVIIIYPDGSVSS